MKFVWIALAIGAIVLIAKMRKGINPRKGGEGTQKSGRKPAPTPHVKPLPLKEKKIWEPAEVAIEKNLNKIAPLLRGVTRDCITNDDEWTSLIVSINNDDLIELWKKCVKRPELWVTYLQTFNLQMDWVDSFEGLKEYKEQYANEDGSEIEVGKKYSVIAPCWIHTNANNQKSVILKGIVKPQ